MLGSEARCPYCLDDLVGEERVVRCVNCRTPHHAACFEEHGGCVAFGCDGSVAGAAGASVLLRRTPIVLGPRWVEVPLLPLEHTVVRYRPSKGGSGERTPSSGAIAIAGEPTVRVSLERTTLHFGQDLRGRIVVTLARDAVVKRLELVIHDESHLVDGSPERVLRAALLGRCSIAPPGIFAALGYAIGAVGGRLPRLEGGKHFFEIEVPRLFGWIVTARSLRRVAVEVLLECLRHTPVRSQRLPVELSEEGRNGDSHRAYVWQLPVQGRRPAAMPAPERAGSAPPDGWIDPSEAERAWTQDVPAAAVPPPRLSPLIDFSAAEPASTNRMNDLARAGAWPRFERAPAPGPVEEGVAHLPTEIRVDPPAPPPAPPAEACEVAARPPAAPRTDPPKEEKLPIVVRPREPRPDAGEGWTLVGFRAEPGGGEALTGRILRARWIGREDVPPLRLSLEAFERRDETGGSFVEALIDTPEAVAWLDIACRYELALSTGTRLAERGFPRSEHAKLVGAGALDPARSGAERAQAIVPIDAALVGAARVPGAVVAEELIVSFSAYGLSATGTLVSSGSREVRVQLEEPKEPPLLD
ncbi:hypothetical protein HY251_09120 [bacterium]|nr:hypothetical protein [bacterium]